MEFILESKLILKGMKQRARREINNRLTIDNPRYQEAVKMGRFTGNIAPELEYCEVDGDSFICPRGFADEAWFICRDHHGEDIKIIDERWTPGSVYIQFNGKLRTYQQEAVKDMLKNTQGVLCAGTGSGKTCMALYLVAERKQPALVIVHTKELLHQWIDRIEAFLGIPRTDIGVIGNGKFSIGSQVTVGMVQTLTKRVDEITERFGHIIVDECHRTPSTTFTTVVNALPAKYRLGLSATPYRRDGLSKVIFWHLGKMRHQVNQDYLFDDGHLVKPEIVWRETEFSTCMDVSQFYSQAMSELTQDQDRNELICSDVATDANQGIKLVLTDRKEHCADLARILEQDFDVKAHVLNGSTGKKDRETLVSNLHQGQVNILIATGQLIGEGFDLPALSTLFLATPVKFKGRLLQYIGRVLRPAEGKTRALIYDYVDVNVGVLKASAMTRHHAYQNQGFEQAA